MYLRIKLVKKYQQVSGDRRVGCEMPGPRAGGLAGCMTTIWRDHDVLYRRTIAGRQTSYATSVIWARSFVRQRLPGSPTRRGGRGLPAFRRSSCAHLAGRGSMARDPGAHTRRVPSMAFHSARACRPASAARVRIWFDLSCSLFALNRFGEPMSFDEEFCTRTPPFTPFPRRSCSPSWTVPATGFPPKRRRKCWMTWGPIRWLLGVVNRPCWICWTAAATRSSSSCSSLPWCPT